MRRLQPSAHVAQKPAGNKNRAGQTKVCGAWVFCRVGRGRLFGRWLAQQNAHRFRKLKRADYRGIFNADTHEVVDVEKCLLHGEWYETLRRILIDFIKKESVSIYNPRTRAGVLRFAVARKIGGAIMLTLVMTKRVDYDFSWLLKSLEKSFGETAVYVNVNNEKTNAVFSDEFIHIAGKRTLSGEMLGIKFELSPNSFYQVNDEIAKTIYEKCCPRLDRAEETELSICFRA